MRAPWYRPRRTHLFFLSLSLFLFSRINLILEITLHAERERKATTTTTTALTHTVDKQKSNIGHSTKKTNINFIVKGEQKLRLKLNQNYTHKIIESTQMDGNTLGISTLVAMGKQTKQREKESKERDRERWRAQTKKKLIQTNCKWRTHAWNQMLSSPHMSDLPKSPIKICSWNLPVGGVCEIIDARSRAHISEIDIHEDVRACASQPPLFYYEKSI